MPEKTYSFDFDGPHGVWEVEVFARLVPASVSGPPEDCDPGDADMEILSVTDLETGEPVPEGKWSEYEEAIIDAGWRYFH